MRQGTVMVATVGALTLTACGVDSIERNSSPAEAPVAASTPFAVAPSEAARDARSEMRVESSPQQAATTTTTEPANEACTETPQAPPFLVDGSDPGEPSITDQGDTTLVVWGEPGPPGDPTPENVTAVHQVLGGEPLDVSLPADSDQHVTVGGFEADVVPIGDPPLGAISIDIADDQGCLRLYYVGPGRELDEAIAFTEAWLSELAGEQPNTTTTTAPPVAPTLPASK